ncbi:MAG: hypothetical protein FWC46_00295, partial [Actinomycetia bacterium]|nr:hypothetical protein [Actinomycetes bacterium]
MNTSQAGFDLDAPGLTGRIGGSLGRHVRIAGVWFDPVPWVFGVGLVAWVLGMAHQTACMTNNPAHFPNAFSGLCYSDISTLYQARDNFWSGAP